MFHGEAGFPKLTRRPFLCMSVFGSFIPEQVQHIRSVAASVPPWHYSAPNLPSSLQLLEYSGGRIT